MEKKYIDELDKGYTPLLVMKEASRCLLCHDAPCSKSCPAGTNPAKFIRSVRFRNFKGAAETIRENNALGSICARVCPTEKLCQKGCSRSGIDKPIEIGRIQRFVTDFEAACNMKILKKGQKDKGKVAVVGSGPAGLQAATTLTALGYDVTIFEKSDKAGGWLRHGIPEYRLPSDVLDLEIQRIIETGITIKYNQEVGKDVSLDELKKEYQAVLLAVGASYGRMLPLFDNNPHVEVAVEFLDRVRQNGGKVEVPSSVLVVGGGDVAMDAATTLKKLGCESVVCVAREEMYEFPASKKEFSDAHEENVSIIDGFTPVGCVDNVVEFEHVRLHSHLTMKVDKIILAVGQVSKLESFDTITHERGIVDTKNYQTSDEKVFAAGDIVKGEKSVVYAVKLGKEAAHAIDAYLGGKKNA